MTPGPFSGRTARAPERAAQQGRASANSQHRDCRHAAASRSSPRECDCAPDQRTCDFAVRWRRRSQPAAVRTAPEDPAKALSAHRIGSFQPIPVSIPMALVSPGELAIDVGDDSGFGGAGKVVRGDNLIANHSQRRSLDVAEEIPASAVTGRAADDEGRAAYGSCSHKLPPRETNANLAAWHWFQP